MTLGTYDDPVILTTDYGPIALSFYAGPSRPAFERRTNTRATDEAPYISVTVRSPSPPQEVAPRGYIDGRQAFVPLIINGRPYRIDGSFKSDDDGFSFHEDRASGSYVRLRKLGLIAFTSGSAVVNLGDDAPTDKARSIAYGVITPTILSALTSGAYLEAIDEARGRAIAEYAEAVAQIEKDAKALVDSVHASLAERAAAYGSTRCPRAGCDHPRSEHTGHGRACERLGCVCYRFGTWTPSGESLAELDAAGV